MKRPTRKTEKTPPDGPPTTATATAPWQATVPADMLQAVAAASTELVEIGIGAPRESKTIIRTIALRPDDPVTFGVVADRPGDAPQRERIIADAKMIATLLGPDLEHPDRAADAVGETTLVTLPVRDRGGNEERREARLAQFTATRPLNGSIDSIVLPDWSGIAIEPNTAAIRLRTAGPQEKPRYTVNTRALRKALASAVELAATHKQENDVRITMTAVNGRGTIEIETPTMAATITLAESIVHDGRRTEVPIRAAGAFLKSTRERDPGSGLPRPTTIAARSITHEIQRPEGGPAHAVTTIWNDDENHEPAETADTEATGTRADDEVRAYQVDGLQLLASLRRARAMTGKELVEIAPDSGTISLWLMRRRAKDALRECLLNAGTRPRPPAPRPGRRSRRIGVRPDRMAALMAIFERDATEADRFDRPSLLMHVLAGGAAGPTMLLSEDRGDGATLRIHADADWRPTAGGDGREPTDPGW